MIRLQIFAPTRAGDLQCVKRISVLDVAHVPRVGDECRLGGINGERYYRVKRIVWCLDERADGMDRANVELEPAQ